MNFLGMSVENWISIGIIFLIILIPKLACYFIYKSRSQNENIKNISYPKLIGCALLISGIAILFVIINAYISCLYDGDVYLLGTAKRTEFLLGLAIPVIIESLLIKHKLDINSWKVWLFSFLSTWGITILIVIFGMPDYFESVKQM